MSVNARKIADLARIADLKKAADLTELARVCRARDAVLGKLQRLDAAVKDACGDRLGETDAGLLVAQESFARLVQAQRSEINIELARCNADCQEYRSTAALSFGRSAVLEKMAEQALADQRRAHQRAKDR
jgi:hypothetical protein